MKSAQHPVSNPTNLELINTPLPVASVRVSERESMIDSIIKDWDNQVFPGELDQARRDDSADLGSDYDSDGESGLEVE